MKKVILSALFLALLLICAVFASACDGGGEKPISTNAATDDATDDATVTSPQKDEEFTEEDAKLEALRILTPRASDKTPIADGKVHCYRNGHGSKIVHDKLEEILGKNAKTGLQYPELGQLYLMLCTEEKDETPTIMCNIEGCKHNDITCPAVVDDNGFVLPVTDEKTGRTVVYTELNVNVKSIPVLGKSVDLVKEFGLPSDKTDAYEYEKHILMEYDMETGERRAVTAVTDEDFFGRMCFDEYYNGRLYFSLDGWVESPYGVSSNFDFHPRMLYVDVASCEIKYCEEPDGEQSFLYFAGIYEDKVYCFSETGEFIKMNLDFGEREVIGKIDNFATEATFDNGSGTRYLIFRYLSAFIDGNLYIETLDSELKKNVTYRCPLSGEWEPELLQISVPDDIYKSNCNDYYLENVEYYYYTLSDD